MKVETKNRQELKGFFKKHNIPTESNFADLIDGMINQQDDGIAKTGADPLSVAAAGGDEIQKVLSLYEGFGENQVPKWTLNLKPKDGTTPKPGLNIMDGGGNSRLFIDQSTGRVGIGTVSPDASLHVNGSLQVDGAAKLANSDVYFTKTDHTYTGTGNTEGYAAIENDGANYNALMILGRTVKSGNTTKRVVKLWDELTVNGTLYIKGGSFNAENGDNFFRYNGAADISLKAASRGAGGRAIVHDGGNTLTLNYAGDFSGGTKIASELTVSGAAKLANSDLYFTKTDHTHSGFGNTEGYAAIENASDYSSLMILGRTVKSGNTTKRVVKLWDELTVYGQLKVSGWTTINMDGPAAKPFHLNAGTNGMYIQNAHANNSDAGTVLNAAPNATLLMGCVWRNNVYFYWKDDTGKKYMATVGGTAF